MRATGSIRRIKSPILLVSVKNNRSEILSRMEYVFCSLPRARVTTFLNEPKRSFSLRCVSYFESRWLAYQRSWYDWYKNVKTGSSIVVDERIRHWMIVKLRPEYPVSDRRSDIRFCFLGWSSEDNELSWIYSLSSCFSPYLLTMTYTSWRYNYAHSHSWSADGDFILGHIFLMLPFPVTLSFPSLYLCSTRLWKKWDGAEFRNKMKILDIFQDCSIIVVGFVFMP